MPAYRSRTTHSRNMAGARGLRQATGTKDGEVEAVGRSPVTTDQRQTCRREGVEAHDRDRITRRIIGISMMV